MIFTSSIKSLLSKVLAGGLANLTFPRSAWTAKNLNKNTKYFINIFVFSVLVLVGKSLFADGIRTEAPSREHWKSFLALPEDKKAQLWLEDQGKFEILSWEWRFAWIRSCEKPKAPIFCVDVLEKALASKPGVVKMKAASAVYSGFKGSDLTKLRDALSEAYLSKVLRQNSFTEALRTKILLALFSLGPQGQEEGGRLITKTVAGKRSSEVLAEKWRCFGEHREFPLPCLEIINQGGIQ